MIYCIEQLQLPLDYSADTLNSAIGKKIRCNVEYIEYSEVIRRSLDARNKPHYVITALFSVKKGIRFLNKPPVTLWQKHEPIRFPTLTGTAVRPAVIGAGPAGLMAALVLAEAGAKPIIFERGSSVGKRQEQVARFWNQGEFNPQSNVLYGEGGAGLFSDGKLTARTKDRPRVRYFFETLVECGAARSILFDAEPHIGSDVLAEIVPRLRQKIVSKGGEFHFDSPVEKLRFEHKTLQSLVVNGDQSYQVNHCILATGHSARDIFSLCRNEGILTEEKSFAIGVRVELPQEEVNRFSYGQWESMPGLGAASFRLTRRAEEQCRACYSFCMCPGGIVIPCASSAGELTTNGMSMSSRASSVANAAFLVPVTEAELQPFGGDGIAFQQALEKKAFLAGGARYGLAASSLSDFLNHSQPTAIPSNRSFRQTVPASLHEFLPDFVSETLEKALPPLLRVFKGLDFGNVLLYGAETRSSSPLRIVRGEDGMSPTHTGLFPCGEGAGYAGGIVSSAVDGIRIAQLLLERLIL